MDAFYLNGTGVEPLPAPKALYKAFKRFVVEKHSGTVKIDFRSGIAVEVESTIKEKNG